MNKNSAGIIVSVKDITEVGPQSVVHCSLCGRDFIPSLNCDVFALEDRAGANGEMPLQCEVCMDRGFASAGIGMLDMSRPDAGRGLRQQASALAQRIEAGQPDELELARESVRRSPPLPTDDLRSLIEAARRIGMESQSPVSQYALIELVHAATVSGAALPDRIEASRVLAMAARKFGRFERARLANADAIEGLQILVRFFNVDAAAAAAAEADIRRDWEALLADDPSEEWLRLLIWNTDEGPPHGAMVHSDAVLRLALRFEDARDSRGLDLTAPVARLRELAASADWLPPGRDRRWLLGCEQAVGDALMEASQWGLAREVHEHVAREAGSLGHDTVALHSIGQLACCDVFEGARDRAMARLAGLEWPKWEALAQMAISVAADMARLEAVRYACRRASGDAAAAGSHVAVQANLAVVSQIARAHPKDRTEYLRALFAAVVSRDVGRLMSL